MTCPSCSAIVPAEARFCPSCGRSLSAAADERRVVTVLFGDLVGFTGLAESRDPETIKNLVDRCFERLAVDITSFGGRVDKVIGDAVVALFGAPVAHEDDAERAVRAALQMQQTLAAQGEVAGADLRMRIGVRTGEVLVGALRAGGDYTAMGDVVNTASRLQSVALPGQVVVGPDTYDLTRDVFRYEPLGPLAVRGREVALDSFVALEPVGAPGRRPRRVRTPLVGRDAEVSMLCSALTTAITYERPHLALIVGEAGLGKSRLAEEVVASARNDHDALVLEGRSLPYGEANVWWPLAEAMRQACLIEPGDDATTARTKCEHAVAEALAPARAPEPESQNGAAADGEVERVAGALTYLMGDEDRFNDVDPGRARDEVGRAVRLYLQALARCRPVVLMISDVQWADAAVLELVDGLLERLHRVRIVVVLTARPELEGTWQPTPGRHNLVVLNLDPLDASSAEELLTTLLDGQASPEVRNLLIERSGGNPFFLEELANLLSESGALETIPAGAVPVLPATLRGLVAARLDALPVSQRSVIEDAAVLGRRGPVAAVEALAATRGGSQIGPALHALVDLDLLRVRENQCEFRSDLVREVAYGTLTKAERARRHANLACWLEEQLSERERTDEFLEELARHSATAAELVSELGAVDGVPADIRERALAALERAAERSEHRETHVVSARLYDQGLRLLGAAPSSTRRHALIGRARARTALRQSELARSDLAIVTHEALSAQDDLALARALTVRGDLERNDGDLASSVETLEEAVATWRRVGDRRGEASALRRLGYTTLFAGDLDVAEELILEALRAFREIGARKGVAWANQNLAWIAFYRGEQDVAEARLNDSISLFADIGDWGGLGWALGLMGWVQYTQGHRAEAERLALETLDDAAGEGEPWAIGMMTVLLASVRLWQGRSREAIEHARRAERSFESMGDRWGQVRALAPLSRALLVSGRRDEAEAAIEQVRSLAPHLASSEEAGFPTLLALGLAVHVGEGGQAVAHFSRPELAVQPEGLGNLEAGALIGLALLQGGQVSESAEWLGRVVERANDVGPRAAALSASALALAAAGRGDEARDAARAVSSLDEGTYLDLVYSLLAVACAAARDGDAAGAHHALDDAAGLLANTDDRLTPCLVALARSRVSGALDEAGAEGSLAAARSCLHDVGVTAEGWDAVFLLATGGTSPSAS